MKKISIIIPAYNEKSTIKELLSKVYGLKIDALEKEIIIVEDNSKDGTREIIQKFCQNHPDCKLILNNIPKGKGHAVRMGFENATGDILAIQDADLEYDTNDYHKLVLPFLDGSNTSFVLGSRHLDENGKKVRMIRKFHGAERLYAYLMNFGGIFLHKFFNILYGTKISDPTTMYKLFTKELYKQVEFEGNYFELDWEIVAKFVRLGYLPKEIPIKYDSRGLKAGKKVKLSRDVIKWLKTIIKFRFLPLNKIIKNEK